MTQSTSRRSFLRDVVVGGVALAEELRQSDNDIPSASGIEPSGGRSRAAAKERWGGLQYAPNARCVSLVRGCYGGQVSDRSQPVGGADPAEASERRVRSVISEATPTLIGGPQ